MLASAGGGVPTGILHWSSWGKPIGKLLLGPSGCWSGIAPPACAFFEAPHVGDMCLGTGLKVGGEPMRGPCTTGQCRHEDASKEVDGDIALGLWGLGNCGTGGSLPWGSGGDAGTLVVLRRPPRTESISWGPEGSLPWGSGGDAAMVVLRRPPKTESMPWDQRLVIKGGLLWCVASIREHVEGVSWDA